MSDSKKREKNDDSRIKVKFSVYFFSVILVIGGLTLFFISKIEDDNPVWKEFFKSICGNIGMTLFSAGLISLIL